MSARRGPSPGLILTTAALIAAVVSAVTGWGWT